MFVKELPLGRAYAPGQFTGNFKQISSDGYCQYYRKYFRT
jgi:hypothetical protein